MIISVIGTHCVGKSTLLKELNKNSNFIVDDFKVSRSVQKLLGYSSLKDAINTPTKMMSFQELILNAKYKNDIKYKSYPKDSIIFVERSFLDISIYASTWFADLKMTDFNWLKDFNKRAMKYQEIYDALILIEPNDDIPFEVDKNRGSLKSRNEFGEEIKGKYMASKTSSLTLSLSDLDYRVKMVNQLISLVK